eukprot:gene15092-21146_t
MGANHSANSAFEQHEPYNQDCRGFPLVIARPASSADVSKCINFVREHGAGIKLCISCGAHVACSLTPLSWIL